MASAQAGGGRAGRPAGIRRSSNGLTDRQTRILRFVEQAVELRGFPPSMREIGEAVGLSSVSSVAYQVLALEKKGHLVRDPHTPPRACRIRHSPWNTLPQDGPQGRSASVDLPVLGQIAAGAPIVAEQEVEDVFTLPRRLVGEGELFILEVRGDSMTGASILPGDWVTIRRQDTARHGDIVAALLDGGEATVKQLRIADGHTWLMPRNPAYDPIPAGQATILGKVVSLLRRL
ncbi:transcriptional repressor LexA [Kitasatospora herbaricolor]|uniref:LexA repressor n=1 Tax=Kitasatospora herbaricolor TaxID=68217 RepID=A0ABZ1WJX1_9ACTN|nr:transcriptional repressor LexA [Kitasatospora herbaricolor]